MVPYATKKARELGIGSDSTVAVLGEEEARRKMEEKEKQWCRDKNESDNRISLVQPSTGYGKFSFEARPHWCSSFFHMCRPVRHFLRMHAPSAKSVPTPRKEASGVFRRMLVIISGAVAAPGIVADV